MVHLALRASQRFGAQVSLWCSCQTQRGRHAVFAACPAGPCRLGGLWLQGITGTVTQLAGPRDDLEGVLLPCVLQAPPAGRSRWGRLRNSRGGIKRALTVGRAAIRPNPYTETPEVSCTLIPQITFHQWLQEML